MDGVINTTQDAFTFQNIQYPFQVGLIGARVNCSSASFDKQDNTRDSEVLEQNEIHLQVNVRAPYILDPHTSGNRYVILGSPEK